MLNKTISIQGRIYELVDRERPSSPNDSRLYKGQNSFVRIGPVYKIDENLSAHRNLEKAGFPVPHILEVGNIANEKYFIEESLGDKILRLQFAEEISSSGQISEQSFGDLLKIMEQYLTAQTKSLVGRDEAAFLEKIHLNKLCEELPAHSSKIIAKAKQCLESLSQFPFALSHGDLSPNNLFPKGVIDLEDTMPAPFGYDAVCVLTTTDWYPVNEDFEFSVTPYHFTAAQKETYLNMCDDVSKKAKLPTVSDHLRDFDFFRAIWLTEGMREWPKTQKYRHERFINHYLT